MLSKNKICLFGVLMLMAVIANAGGGAKPIGPFSISGLVGWQSKSFLDLTDYQLVLDQDDQVLKANSNGKASALIYKQRIDLHQTPWLNWRWKIEQPLAGNAETTKSGDDYAARIYVIIDGGMLKWRSKALTYVWSSRSGDIPDWPNAFVPKNAMMIAVRNAEHDIDTWHSEKRNVLTDLEQAFGQEIRYIDAVAIMTDTDNTGQSASAFYGDLFFSEQ